MAGRPKGCGARDGLQECGHRVSGEARLGSEKAKRPWSEVFFLDENFQRVWFMSWMFMEYVTTLHLTICRDYWILLPTVTCFLPHRNTT